MNQPCGPIFERVEAVLADTATYAAFRAGRLGGAEYAAFLDDARGELVAGGVPDEDVDYAKRYPADLGGFIDASLATLLGRGVIADSDYDPELLEAAERLLRSFDHAGRSTYIYPEEAMLLAALTDIRRPRRAVVLGSYYGYWVAAALPALRRHGGRITLVDPDPDCCGIARRNFAAEIADGAVTVACARGEDVLAAGDSLYDFVVIDAELPRDHPVASMRGKGVYASLLAAALPRLTGDALLVCHNILLSDQSGAAVFEGIIDRNRRELAAFQALAQRHFPNWTEIPSTEGVGVGLRGTR